MIKPFLPGRAVILCLCMLMYCSIFASGAKAEEAAAPPAEKETVAMPQPSEPETQKSDQQTYPGTENRHFQAGGEGKPSISLYYPAFGNQAVDQTIEKYIRAEAKDYEADAQESVGSDGEKPESYDMWEMTGFYTMERPSPHVRSIVFNTYLYSGGAHGMLNIDCMNFNLDTGKLLTLADLFANPEKAVQIMSELSSQRLHKELGEEADEDMIASGTAPDAANFNNLTLVPTGLFVEFQPYQVGPWAIGPQRVEFTLEDLAEAGPSPQVWPIPEKDTPEAE